MARQVRQSEKAKPQERYAVGQVVAAIHATQGNVSVAARNLGCDRSTVQRYAHRHPSVAAAIADERETLVDHAESALRAAVLEKEGWAVCFTLKTLGKERGYVERQEQVHSGPDGGPIPLAVIDRVVQDADRAG